MFLNLRPSGYEPDTPITLLAKERTRFCLCGLPCGRSSCARQRMNYATSCRVFALRVTWRSCNIAGNLIDPAYGSLTEQLATAARAVAARTPEWYYYE